MHPKLPSGYWTNDRVDRYNRLRADATIAALAQNLVDPPKCTTHPACLHCFYCKLAKWGPEWWVR